MFEFGCFGEGSYVGPVAVSNKTSGEMSISSSRYCNPNNTIQAGLDPTSGSATDSRFAIVDPSFTAKFQE